MHAASLHSSTIQQIYEGDAESPLCKGDAFASAIARSLSHAQTAHEPWAYQLAPQQCDIRTHSQAMATILPFGRDRPIVQGTTRWLPAQIYKSCGDLRPCPMRGHRLLIRPWQCSETSESLHAMQVRILHRLTQTTASPPQSYWSR